MAGAAASLTVWEISSQLDDLLTGKVDVDSLVDPRCSKYGLFGGFLKWGYPKMDGL